VFPARNKWRALPIWVRPCVTCPDAEACEEHGCTDGSARQSRLSRVSPTSIPGVTIVFRFDFLLRKTKNATISLMGAPLLCLGLGSRHCFQDSNDETIPISSSTHSRDRVSNGHAKDFVRKILCFRYRLAEMLHAYSHTCLNEGHPGSKWTS
jgi:hypothetical protein